MKKEKGGPKPADDGKQNPISQQYIGSNIAKAYQEKKAADNLARSTDDEGREIYPVEMKRFLAQIRRNHNIIMAGATVGMLVVTAIYAGFAALQWFALSTTNDIAQQSLVAVQRAFITFDGVNLDTARKSLQSQDMVWAFSAITENSGATPATNKVQYFSADNALETEPSEDQFIGNLKNLGMGEVGPRSKKLIGPIVKSDDFILGTFHLTDVGSSKFRQFFETKRVFFWGWVVYRDAFPRTPLRLTEFCEELNGIAVDTVSPSASNPLAPKWKPRLSLMECNQHNCTDEYCPDYQLLTAEIMKQGRLPSESDPFGLDRLR